MAHSQPSELALRELLAVSIGTVSCYATLAPFLGDAQALAEVLAEAGHSDLAAELTQAAQAVNAALDHVSQLAIAHPRTQEVMHQGDQEQPVVPTFPSMARYPAPGTQQARPDASWAGAVPPAGGFTNSSAGRAPVPWYRVPGVTSQDEDGS